MQFNQYYQPLPPSDNRSLSLSLLAGLALSGPLSGNPNVVGGAPLFGTPYPFIRPGLGLGAPFYGRGLNTLYPFNFASPYPNPSPYYYYYRRPFVY